MRELSFVIYGLPTPYKLVSRAAWSAKAGRHVAITHETKHCKAWKTAARMVLQAEMESGRHSPLTGPLQMQALAVFPLPPSAWRRHPVSRQWHTKMVDASNILKACEDSCNEIVFADDSQIVDTRCTKVIGAQGERAHVVITVREVDWNAPQPNENQSHMGRWQQTLDFDEPSPNPCS